jgi:hypothetical protein
LSYRPPRFPAGTRPPDRGKQLPLAGRRAVAYWSDGGPGRLQLLGCAVQYFTENRWGRSIDTGWSDWDVEVFCHPWTVVQICTAEEEHGGGRRLVRVRYRLRPSEYLLALAAVAVVGGVIGATLPLVNDGGLIAAWAGGLLAAAAGLWWRGTRRAALAVAVVDRSAAELGMIRLDEPRAARHEDGHASARTAGLESRLQPVFSGPAEAGTPTPARSGRVGADQRTGRVR